MRNGGVGDGCGRAGTTAEAATVVSSLIGVGGGVVGQDLDELLVLGVGERGAGVAQALGDLVDDVPLRGGIVNSRRHREYFGSAYRVRLGRF